METYPFTIAQHWAWKGHLRGVHGDSTFKVGKLVNPDKAVPLPDKTVCTVETRNFKVGKNRRTEWYVYTPTYWFFMKEQAVFDKLITFK